MARDTECLYVAEVGASATRNYREDVIRFPEVRLHLGEIDEALEADSGESSGPLWKSLTYFFLPLLRGVEAAQTSLREFRVQATPLADPLLQLKQGFPRLGKRKARFRIRRDRV